MYPDLCDGCRKPIATDHPFNLCPDCDLRRETQAANERAWSRAPLSKRAAVRLLEGAAVLCGFIFGSLAVWILEPSFDRLVNHLWPLLVLGGSFAACYFSYWKAKEQRKGIADSEPIVTWYQQRTKP